MVSNLLEYQFILKKAKLGVLKQDSNAIYAKAVFQVSLRSVNM